tara:strand:+ start:255 stop:749 length:495 start_codon:yes stop_codon:yes gene_type:complete
MRHAESGFKDYDCDDFSRPISSEGELTTKNVSRFLRKEQNYFDLVFCSPALRAKQTLYCLIESLYKKPPEIIEDYNLYEGNEENFLLRISKIQKSKNILVLTHEPQISYFINYFLAHTKPNQEFLNFDFVTSCLVTLEFNVRKWSEISIYNVVLKRFLDPNELS